MNSDILCRCPKKRRFQENRTRTRTFNVGVGSLNHYTIILQFDWEINSYSENLKMSCILVIIIEIWADMKYICTAFLDHTHIVVWPLGFTFIFNLCFCNKICIESLGLFLDTQSHRAPPGSEWDGDCS